MTILNATRQSDKGTDVPRSKCSNYLKISSWALSAFFFEPGSLRLGFTL